MGTHDTECPYGDQVSLNNTNQPTPWLSDCDEHLKGIECTVCDPEMMSSNLGCGELGVHTCSPSVCKV